MRTYWSIITKGIGPFSRLICKGIGPAKKRKLFAGKKIEVEIDPKIEIIAELPE